MRVIQIEILLKENVLVNSFNSGDPNSAVSLDYIPGSVIRGALIDYFQKNAQEDKQDRLQDFFFNGNINFLNAYLCYEENGYRIRTLPAPISFQMLKDNNSFIYDLAVSPVDNANKIYKSFPEQFCQIDNIKGKCRGSSPSSITRMHIRKNRSDLRIEEQQVFSYQALQNGQYFCGMILSPERDFSADFLAIFPDGMTITLSIGKSRSTEYGNTQFTFSHTPGEWHEYSYPDNKNENKTIITLLSDLILRNPRTGGAAHDLEPLLGIKASEQFTAYRKTGGFNRTWKSPLPQFYAIKAGSVFVYKNDTSIKQKLETFIQTGIGERREEGFGRIAVNWQNRASMPYELMDESLDRSHATTISDEGEKKIIYLMLRKVINNRLSSTLVEKSNQILIQDAPSNAQISRLRLIFSNALTAQIIGKKEPLRIVTAHLDRLTLDIRKQFEKAHVDDMNLLEWCRYYCDHPENIWKTFGCENKEKTSISIGGIQPDLSSLAENFCLQYMDTVFHAILEKRKKEKENAANT